MTKIERSIAGERAVNRAFEGGELLRRELRLSDEEAAVFARYAVLTPMAADGGEKRWYDVRLKGAKENV